MVDHVWSSLLTRLRGSRFGEGSLIDFCLELASISATLCCKHFPYWNPKKIPSCSVGDNALAFNHCQRGIFPEDSETASLWSQAAFLDVVCDGNSSQFWSTSSTGLGYTHHVSMSSCHIWSSFSTSIMGARDILIHSNMCVGLCVKRCQGSVG